MHVLHSVSCNTFSECCNPRFLNITKIAMQNHEYVINTLPTVEIEDRTTNQTFRTIQSLIASTRHYNKAPL